MNYLFLKKVMYLVGMIQLISHNESSLNLIINVVYISHHQIIHIYLFKFKDFFSLNKLSKPNSFKLFLDLKKNKFGVY